MTGSEACTDDQSARRQSSAATRQAACAPAPQLRPDIVDEGLLHELVSSIKQHECRAEPTRCGVHTHSITVRVRGLQRDSAGSRRGSAAILSRERAVTHVLVSRRDRVYFIIRDTLLPLARTVI